MLKIVGICILLFAIFYISRRLCEKESARIFLLSEISRFLHEVRHSILVSMKPLADICKSFKTDEQYFSSLLLDELKPLASPSSAMVFAERVGDGASGVFVGFVRGFGHGYLAEEIARCDSAIREFDEICAKERAAIAKRVRVCRTLGVASSFALVILFI